MGLTADSTGLNATDNDISVVKLKESDRVVALAGNPNVGKSTVFNALTGMNQHTGNWPGKTVASAQGRYAYQGIDYILVDLPGTYSLMAHSAEEEIARDFIMYGGADATIVVCDATCLERNLNLVLQTAEITDNVVVCINLMDEAAKKGIQIHFDVIENIVGVPVVAASARAKKGLDTLMDKVHQLKKRNGPPVIAYPDEVENALHVLIPFLSEKLQGKVNARWIALRLLSGEMDIIDAVKQNCGVDLSETDEIMCILSELSKDLEEKGIAAGQLKDMIVSATVKRSEEIYGAAVTKNCEITRDRDRKLDKILTSKATGIPVMLGLLAVVFWLTITASNYPSELLASGLFWIQDRLTDFFMYMNAPDWLHGALVLGIYRVLAWVVSVMLPPMAIFFPLFTLLEDFGYLPRVAFNLDHHFKKACACGKQALTMCMGFGCNAAGVVGCRIIDSPRERLIAIITNNFVPCNGRFPTLIAIITMFFVGANAGSGGTLLSALILTGTIVMGVFLTFAVSRLLSVTVLKGEPSSFTLELPPYRMPQFGQVIVRSIFDRTLFVLGRAVVVAAPAGLLIWLMANVVVGDMSVLAHCSGFLDPFGRLLGMDGVILLAFILGFPANEIVVPVIIMAYLSSGTLLELDSLWELKALFVSNGWTWVTAVSTMMFCLVHWPCSTTCLTIKKETGSWKWTGLSILLPTAIGMAVCFIFTTVVRLLGLA